MYAQTSAGFFARISEIMERTKIYKASATNIHRASPVKAVPKLKFSKISSIVSYPPLGAGRAERVGLARRVSNLGARVERTT